MVVGEIAESVDLLVVGAGPGGYTAALRAARLGREVVLVDRDGPAGVGGVCLRTGCIPGKALVQLADTAAAVSAMGPAGLRVEGLTVDLAQFQRWKDGVVRKLADGVRAQLDRAGVRVVAGEFRLTRPREGVVETPDGRAEFFAFHDAVLATGSRARQVAALPRDGATVLDPADALALDEVLGCVAIVGADYVAVELATAMAKLGSQVVVVCEADRVLADLDPALSRAVARGLRALGVEVRAGVRAAGAADGWLTLETDGGGAGGADRVRADRVIVAAGWTPNTDDLGLDLAGIAVGPDGLLRPGGDRRVAAHVAAIGDLTPGPALAHKASAEAGVAAEALCGRRSEFAPTAVPVVVFSDPQVASVGLTRDQAAAEGISVGAATLPLGTSGRAATLGARTGFVLIVVDRDADAVVGVHIAGPAASELAGEAVLAVEMGAAPADLAYSIHPHPTSSEQVADAARLLVWEVETTSP